MTAREPSSVGSFAEIPDPAAEVAKRTPPDVAPPLEASPTRGDRRLRGLLTLAASLGWIGALLVRFGLRPDLMISDAATQIGVWTAVGAAGLFVAMRPGGRGLPRSLGVVQIVLAAVVVGFAGLAILFAAPGAGAHAESNCMAAGAFMSLGPLVLAAIFLRRSLLSAPAWRAATVGAICGLGGAIGIHAHCPLATMGHVLVTHGLPIALGALLGALWGALRGRI